MTNWRSCVDDPPDQGKWVLVRYSILYHGRLHPYSYTEACWSWNNYKRQREWVDADGFLLPKKHGLADDELTWTEIPQ